METIIAIGAAHALYFSFLLVGKSQKNLTDLLLLILFLLLAGTFGLVYLSVEWDAPILQIPIWNISLLIAPVFYFYTISLMSGSPKIKRSWYFQLLPYCLSSFYLLYIFIVYPEPVIDHLLETGIIITAFPLFNFFSLLELLATPFYVFLIFRLLKKHELKIFEIFSNIENRGLQWLKYLIIGMLGMWFIINGFVYLTSAVDDLSIKYGFGFATIFIFHIGYYGVKQSVIFTHFEVVNTKKEPLDNSKKYEKF